MKKNILLLFVVLNVTRSSVGVAATFKTAYFEAEGFSGQSGCTVSTSNFPYIGKGYLDMGGKGSYAEWSSINAPAAGRYTLIIKYAKGSGANRQCELKVNGTVVKSIPFTSIYKDWKWYWNARVTVSLKRGLNTVRLTSNTANGGPNIDNIAVSSNAVIKPPTPIFNITDYGAVGDSVTDNTQAIQKAINACSGTNGSVVIPAGVFISGELMLKSNMTLWVSEGATLRGSPYKAAYPEFRPNPASRVNWPGKEGELGRGLVCSNGANNFTITGGGKIDGNARVGESPTGALNDCAMGDHNGTSTTRPALLYLALGRSNISITNIDIVNGACWGVALIECDDVTIDGINERNDFAANGDGIDIMDCHGVRITNTTIVSVDDALCPKSCVARGVDGITIENVSVVTNCGGLKLGTDSYGSFKNITATDVAMQIASWHNGNAAVELNSADGADISNINYSNLNVSGFPSFVFILNGANLRGNTPIGSPKNTGAVVNISIKNVDCRSMATPTGSVISGLVTRDKIYRVDGVHFTNVNVQAKGGVNSVPADPAEYSGKYPKGSVFGNVPAWGYYIRHANNVTFTNCNITVSPSDARQAIIKVDVTTADNRESMLSN
jgi:polygalacturonase